MLAHLLLHADLYSGKAFGTVEGWLKFQEGLDTALVDRYEWQARNLAGRILVPAEPLVRLAPKALDERRADLPPDVVPDLLWQYLAIPLAPKFEVSDDVVAFRLSGDGIGKRLRLIGPMNQQFGGRSVNPMDKKVQSEIDFTRSADSLRPAAR